MLLLIEQQSLLSQIPAPPFEIEEEEEIFQSTQIEEKEKVITIEPVIDPVISPSIEIPKKAAPEKKEKRKGGRK